MKYHLPYNPKLKKMARYLRKNMTNAERKIWYEYLRDFKYRILRQKPIDNYIVDFYCPKLKLVIEIDGNSHFFKKGIHCDSKKDKKLEKYGLRILRITNKDVFENLSGIGEVIDKIPPTPFMQRGSKKNKKTSPFTKGEMRGT